jgi:hypothetical protein
MANKKKVTSTDFFEEEPIEQVVEPSRDAEVEVKVSKDKKTKNPNEGKKKLTIQNIVEGRFYLKDDLGNEYCIFQNSPDAKIGDVIYI